MTQRLTAKTTRLLRLKPEDGDRYVDAMHHGDKLVVDAHVYTVKAVNLEKDETQVILEYVDPTNGPLIPANHPGAQKIFDVAIERFDRECKTS